MPRSNLCIYLSKQQPLPCQIPPASDLEKAAPRNAEIYCSHRLIFFFFLRCPVCLLKRNFSEI